MRADLVCQKLIEIWSRTGIPREVRSDRGSSFMSELVTGLQRMMGCTPVFHSAFHHSSSGTVERYIQSLKHTLRKFIHDNPKWTELLPYLLFAYREVEHSSTGLSPFQCVYGLRQPRGPLEILKEAWSNENPALPSKQSVVQYLLETRNNLEKCTELVRENAEAAKEKSKLWYDKYSSDRSFKPGDQVLVLLPTSTNRLLSRWEGPGDILRRVNDVSYEVSINGRISILHVNLLRAWIDRAKLPNLPQVKITLVADACAADYECLKGLDDYEAEPEVGIYLTDDQRAELQRLVHNYPDVFTDKLGYTDLVEHVIELTDDNPVVARNYRIPDSLRDKVSAQIEQMLKEGIIQESNSDFRCPLLAVKKSDNSIRVVADLRAINEKTKDSQYPACDPRLIIDRCANAKYISTCDINQAFFQVNLAVTSRRYCAFAAPNGRLYEFCRMPMGAKCSSKTFQRLANKVLEGAEDHAACHVDDIVIFSKS